jgi:catechol 2,3-dioxygenase-like lactoylglutathione lyase family enzyme
MLFDKEIKIYISSTKLSAAKYFYKDKLGLMILSEKESGIELRANGVSLTIQFVKSFTPQKFTVLGWRVKNIAEIVSLLNNNGIHCERYESLQQDYHGIWTSLEGVKQAWFKDPDGNILSISE